MSTKPPVWPYKKETDEVPSNVKSSDYKDIIKNEESRKNSRNILNLRNLSLILLYGFQNLRGNIFIGFLK